MKSKHFDLRYFCCFIGLSAWSVFDFMNNRLQV